MNVGSLFSGVGGIDLGLERAGMRVAWQCEADPFCRSVLRHHWPDVPCYDDVRSIGSDAERVDLVCGGFPCQPTSQAAARTARGDGWMWPEMARVIERLRPNIALVENPEALRYAYRGLGELLDDLSELGFAVEWRVVRAAEVGAPHRRARLWLVAHANRDWQPVLAVDDEASLVQESAPAFPDWSVVPDLPVDDGVPEGMAVRAYGNAAMPHIAEWIGRRIMEAEAVRAA